MIRTNWAHWQQQGRQDSHPGNAAEWRRMGGRRLARLHHTGGKLCRLVAPTEARTAKWTCGCGCVQEDGRGTQRVQQPFAGTAGALVLKRPASVSTAQADLAPPDEFIKTAPKPEEKKGGREDRRRTPGTGDLREEPS